MSTATAGQAVISIDWSSERELRFTLSASPLGANHIESDIRQVRTDLHTIGNTFCSHVGELVQRGGAPMCLAVLKPCDP